jgi:heat shock protein HtpX
MRRAASIGANLVKVALVWLALCSVLGALGWALGGYRLLTVFALSGVSLAATVHWYGDRLLLGALGARELPVAEAPLVHSTVERLALKARVLKPKLHLLPDGHPRAFVVGRGPAGSSLAVSRGLLAAVRPAELEGLLAHELAHVARRDVGVQTLAVTGALTTIELSRVGGWFSRGLLFVLGPIAAAFVHLLLSPRRELAADREAAELCETPHGLADALLRLEQTVELVAFEASPATEPLYPVNPFLEEGLAGLFVTHPPIAERVGRLRALDPDWRERRRAA